MGLPKQLLPLGGRPIASWSLAALAKAASVNAIVIACEPEQRPAFEAIVEAQGEGKVERIVAGGATRQQSVFAAIRAMARPRSIVVVHDGARPFATSELVEEVISSARRSGGAIAAIPVKDTMKLADETRTVLSTISRNRLWAAQTPQAFGYEILVRAYERAEADGFSGTDDAELVEHVGGTSIAVVEASSQNLKITTPDDLQLAECLAARKDGRS
jgi:2-C-methyl-D-erythritol 4-phosphate cytidylyltransferase